MRKTFNNAQLAHVWAQQTQPEGRGSHFFFEGPTLYSYGRHFIVAEFATAADGSRVALFNNERYSLSTARHQGYAWQAVHGLGVRMFHVARPDASGYGAGGHEGNLLDYAKRIETATLTAIRARTQAGWKMQAASDLWSEARDYAAAFAQPFDIPEPVFTPEFIAAIRAREAARAETERAAREERARQNALDLADKILEWRSGANVTLWERDLPTMLRVRGDTVQTSLGAEVPVAHAVRAWPILKRCRDRGEGWRPNGHKLPLGLFEADAIEPDGTLKAGCHVIPWAEIESTARTLGLVEG